MIRRLKNEQSGFSLPEVIVASMLFALVASVAGGLIITATLAERTVRTVVGGTTDGQLAADSIQTGIRNSSDFNLTVPASGDQLLQARIPRGINNVVWNCASWYYDNADGGSIRYMESEYQIGTPSASALNNWTVLVTGIEPGDTAGPFEIVSGALEVTYKVSTGAGNPPTSIKTSVTNRADVVESAPCF